MEIHGKKLDDMKVAIARGRFERNQASYGRKGLLTFDQLLERFAMDCNPITDIAKDHGVSQQAMHQLHDCYFRDLFPGKKSGRKRQRVCRLKRLYILERDFSISEVESWVNAIVVTAQENGFSARRCRIQNASSMKSFKKGELFINNRHCELHLMTSAHRMSKHSKMLYSDCQVHGSASSEFIVIRQEIGSGRTFIIPRDDLRKSYGEQGIIHIYIPAEKSRILRCPPILDLWQYEDAWHLLR